MQVLHIVLGDLIQARPQPAHPWRGYWNLTVELPLLAWRALWYSVALHLPGATAQTRAFALSAR